MSKPDVGKWMKVPGPTTRAKSARGVVSVGYRIIVGHGERDGPGGAVVYAHAQTLRSPAEAAG